MVCFFVAIIICVLLFFFVLSSLKPTIISDVLSDRFCSYDLLLLLDPPLSDERDNDHKKTAAGKDQGQEGRASPTPTTRYPTHTTFPATRVTSQVEPPPTGATHPTTRPDPAHTPHGDPTNSVPEQKQTILRYWRPTARYPTHPSQAHPTTHPTTYPATHPPDKAHTTHPRHLAQPQQQQTDCDNATHNSDSAGSTGSADRETLRLSDNLCDDRVGVPGIANAAADTKLALQLQLQFLQDLELQQKPRQHAAPGPVQPAAMNAQSVAQLIMTHQQKLQQQTSDWHAELSTRGRGFVCSPTETVLRKTPLRVCIALGPEGGWTPSEIELFCSHNFLLAHMGPHILRSDTALVAALAIVRSVATYQYR